MCKVMQLHPSGYYAWKAAPHSPRAKDDHRLLGLLKQAWLESGGVYGYRKLTLDMRELGERCGKHRVARLLKIEAVKQITERGHRVADVSARIGVSQHSLYKWIKAYAVPAPERQLQTSQTEELRRLKAALKRVTEERDILKKAAFAKQSG